jgi:hypothetical protein
VYAPEGVDSGTIVKELKSRFAAVITNGQGEMKGKIFRIAHLGFFDYMDTIALVGALEQVVAKAPFKPKDFAFGHGLIAAQKVYAEATHPKAEERSCICGRKDESCSLQHSEAGANAPALAAAK